MARKVSEIALELADREAIRDCLLRYPRAVDRIDIDLLSGFCWPDAVESHAGIFKGRVVDFFPVVESIARQFELSQHFYCNMLIEIEGTQARSETYAFIYQEKEDEGGRSSFLAGGRVLGTFEKRDDEWRIIERAVVVDWIKNIPHSADWLEDPLAHKLTGGRKPDDPSMTHFKTVFASA